LEQARNKESLSETLFLTMLIKLSVYHYSPPVLMATTTNDLHSNQAWLMTLVVLDQKVSWGNRNQKCFSWMARWGPGSEARHLHLTKTKEKQNNIKSFVKIKIKNQLVRRINQNNNQPSQTKYKVVSFCASSWSKKI